MRERITIHLIVTCANVPRFRLLPFTLAPPSPAAAWTVVLCTTASLMTGCVARREQYDVPAVVLPTSYRNVQSTRGRDMSTVAAAVQTSKGRKTVQPMLVRLLDGALPQWWQLLISPELDALMARALTSNQDLRAANARITQALARAGQADADHYPTVSLTGSSAIDAPAGGVGSVLPGGEIKSSKTHKIGLSGEWRADLWGERQAASDSADLQVLRATFQRDDVQRQLVADIASTYIEYLVLNDRLRVAHESEAVFTEMLSMVEARFKAKDASALDLEQQRATVYAAQAAIPTQEQQRAEASTRLALLVGAVPGSLSLSDKGLDSLYFPDVIPGVPGNLLLRRPDVRMMEAKLLSADADIDVARARVLPALDLTGQLGQGSHAWGSLLSSHSLFWGAVASLSVAIFDHGKRQQEVGFARAVHEELAEGYVKTIHTAVREVEDSMNAIEKTGRRLSAQEKATTSSRAAWQYSREGWRAGAVEYMTALDAQRSWYRSRDELHVVHRDRYRALVSLFSALGGGVDVGASLPGEGVRPEVTPVNRGRVRLSQAGDASGYKTVAGREIAGKGQHE
ncbi:MAG: efflux transporter outer membrane subunit [Rhodocyclaceae bacterium]|nr:efflux transporter outer membrane subunit [Rhodocyclaceae bacterium]